MLTCILVPGDTSPEELENIRNRFRIRRSLANLSRYPEGYAIVLPLGGRRHEVVLLTPPDLVAVQRADGTWYRRARNVAEDGLMPYTFAWYQEYLVEHDLPYYFMRPELYNMLEGTAEADALGITNSLAALPDPDYTWTRRRYPQAIQYLLPDSDVSTNTTPVDINAAQAERLGMRFPAITVNTEVFDDYRVYVHPTGHLTVRYTHDNSADAVDRTQFRTLYESRSSYLASYRIEGREMGITASNNRDRTQESANARANGGIVDSDEQPNGLGQFDWLDREVDAEIAMQYGLNRPEGVMRARENGVLTNVPLRHRPLTVWRPDLRFLNPSVQPEGQGRWEYTTIPSRDLAWMNLGNQEHFDNIPHPTATQVFDRRRQTRDEIARGDRSLDADTTIGIDIVWVPTVSPGDLVLDPPRSPTPPQEDGLIDPKTGLAHQPKNDGKHDQTGVEGERNWQTIKINGKIFTLDRSRAHKDSVQEWKSWTVNAKGQWYQWKQYSSIDWTNEVSVESMNKWREQATRRVGFYPKRELDRPDYTQPERTWVFGYVKDSKGERPTTTIAEITRLFNERFVPQRDEIGIQSLIDRLRKEYRKNGGNQKPNHGRGRRSSAAPTATDTSEVSDKDDEDEDLDEDGNYQGDGDEDADGEDV